MYNCISSCNRLSSLSSRYYWRNYCRRNWCLYDDHSGWEYTVFSSLYIRCAYKNSQLDKTLIFIGKIEEDSWFIFLLFSFVTACFFWGCPTTRFTLSTYTTSKQCKILATLLGISRWKSRRKWVPPRRSYSWNDGRNWCMNLSRINHFPDRNQCKIYRWR